MVNRIEAIHHGLPSDAEHQVMSIAEQYRDRVGNSVKDAAMLSFSRAGQPRHQVNVRVSRGLGRQR